MSTAAESQEAPSSNIHSLFVFTPTETAAPVRTYFPVSSISVLPDILNIDKHIFLMFIFLIRR